MSNVHTTCKPGLETVKWHPSTEWKRAGIWLGTIHTLVGKNVRFCVQLQSIVYFAIRTFVLSYAPNVETITHKSNYDLVWFLTAKVRVMVASFHSVQNAHHYRVSRRIGIRINGDAIVSEEERSF